MDSIRYETICSDPARDCETNHSPYFTAFADAEMWLTRNVKPHETARIELMAIDADGNTVVVAGVIVAGYTATTRDF